MSDNRPSTSWAVWAWQAYQEGRLVEAHTLPTDHTAALEAVKDAVWEEAAKVVDGYAASGQWPKTAYVLPTDIAAAIRARKDKP
jgi:hypothetical protein